MNEAQLIEIEDAMKLAEKFFNQRTLDKLAKTAGYSNQRIENYSVLNMLWLVGKAKEAMESRKSNVIAINPAVWGRK